MGKKYARGFLLHDLFPKNAIGAEIGIFRGYFSNAVLAYAKPKMYHMIDPWKFRKGWKRYDYKGKLIENQEIVDWMYKDIHKIYSKPNTKIHRGYSYDIIDEFEDEYFDFVYIDGDHAYLSVLQDLRLFYPKLKIGGLMSGDDWNIRGNRVKRAVREFTKEVGIEKINTRTGQFWFYRR